MSEDFEKRAQAGGNSQSIKKIETSKLSIMEGFLGLREIIGPVESVEEAMEKLETMKLIEDFEIVSGITDQLSKELASLESVLSEIETVFRSNMLFEQTQMSTNIN